MIWTLPIMCRLSCKMLLMSYCARSSFLLIIKSKASKWRRTKPHVVLCRESNELKKKSYKFRTRQASSTNSNNNADNICAHTSITSIQPEKKEPVFSLLSVCLLHFAVRCFLDVFQFIYFSIIIIILFVIHNLIHFYSIVCRSPNVRHSICSFASLFRTVHRFWHNIVIHFCFFPVLSSSLFAIGSSLALNNALKC